MRQSNTNAGAKSAERPIVSRKDRPWTISEMSKEYGVTYRTLRFYQQKGLLSPGRRGNTRLYTPRDRAHMKLISVGRKIGMPLTEIASILNAFHERGKPGQNAVIEKSLEEHISNLTAQHAEISTQLDEALKLAKERPWNND